ncbi:hypothetical protein BaRGS_00017403 [Batillaria attramentaria]|uniref:Uncharacterized protein n=1 Tax=Batillaria attramentaria TaxID=370345 RepID=A0ABD0KW12_9CAEN
MDSFADFYHDISIWMSIHFQISLAAVSFQQHAQVKPPLATRQKLRVLSNFNFVIISSVQFQQAVLTPSTVCQDNISTATRFIQCILGNELQHHSRINVTISFHASMPVAGLVFHLQPQ